MHFSKNAFSKYAFSEICENYSIVFNSIQSCPYQRVHLAAKLTGSPGASLPLLPGRSCKTTSPRAEQGCSEPRRLFKGGRQAASFTKKYWFSSCRSFFRAQTRSLEEIKIIHKTENRQETIKKNDNEFEQRPSSRCVKDVAKKC